jgi:hypothetical protein
MANRERFQIYCRRCLRPFEGDTVGEALNKVTEHEKKCVDKPKPAPAPKSLEESRP